MGIDVDPAGVHVLLLRMRGRLHHYQSPDKTFRWTPFRQDDFEAVAFLAQGIAINALLLREAALNGTPDRVWWTRPDLR